MDSANAKFTYLSRVHFKFLVSVSSWYFEHDDLSHDDMVDDHNGVQNAQVVIENAKDSVSDNVESASND